MPYKNVQQASKLTQPQLSAAMIPYREVIKIHRVSGLLQKQDEYLLEENMWVKTLLEVFDNK